MKPEVRNLPIELVERILAMVPFPFVFKARVLSKSWLSRFSQISSLHDGEDKRSVISFQKMIGEWSTKWTSFCPVTVNRLWRVEGMDLYGYERASRTWRRLPSLSFLPDSIWKRGLTYRGILQIQGALVLIKAFQKKTFLIRGDLYVANILTQSWKRLPPCERGAHFMPDCLLVSHTPETYKVIIITCETVMVNRRTPSTRTPNRATVQIYNSQTSSWKKLYISDQHNRADSVFSHPTAAYVDGVLYKVGSYCSIENTLSILAIDIKEETLDKLHIPIEDSDIPRLDSFGLPMSHVLMIIPRSFRNRDKSAFQVSKVSLQSMWEASRGAPAYLELEHRKDDNNSTVNDVTVLSGVENDGRLLLVPRKDTSEWRCFPFIVNRTWGLNAFVAV